MTDAKLVTFNLNGKDVEAPEGANVLQVAKDKGVSIAHYCYHEALPIAGVCRLCMVEVDGHPKPQPSCNITVKAGMKIVSNSQKIKDIVKWGLQFHLINHPLDCPICDQAGECVLQESYVQYGVYDSNMIEPKVHKKKVVDLGPRIVLDKERCILCARCTRFTDHVTKTHDLGIFNRGDRSEIGTYDDKPFDNDYSLNTVDICPVGALTSKDFRFKQRVWFTSKNPSTCIKCATGCSIDVWGNTNGQHRVTPRKNTDNNQWWMCDDGRTAYRWLNPEARYSTAFVKQSNQLTFIETDLAVQAFHKSIKSNRDDITWLISPQHTTEEYSVLYNFFIASSIDDSNVFQWIHSDATQKEFDGFLKRRDKNPNTKGLEYVSTKSGYRFDPKRFTKEFLSHDTKHLVIIAPENTEAYPNLNTFLTEISAQQVTWVGSVRPSSEAEKIFSSVIPTHVFSEKKGAYINANGITQTIQPFMKPNKYTWGLSQIFHHKD